LDRSWFVALDGDQVGRRIEKLILSAKLSELSSYSKSVLDAIKTLESILLKAGGQVYITGGDNLLAEVTDIDLFLSNFISLRDELVCSFCVGIGKDSIEAYLALKFAKSCAPRTIVKAEELEINIQFQILN
jgi:GTP cyclohydrolase III